MSVFGQKNNVEPKLKNLVPELQKTVLERRGNLPTRKNRGASSICAETTTTAKKVPDLKKGVTKTYIEPLSGGNLLSDRLGFRY